MGFTIGEVIGRTFRAFGRNWVALVAANAIAALLAMVPLVGWAAVTMPALFVHGTRELSGPVIAGAVGPLMLGAAGSFVLWILFAPALSRMALAAARDQRPRIGELFDFRRAGI
ncbi:MAG TPA: hypothetical protein VLU41_17090, partial [Ideonella sp.]|nr:hypothetical protein [Ideonella sp.]